LAPNASLAHQQQNLGLTLPKAPSDAFKQPTPFSKADYYFVWRILFLLHILRDVGLWNCPTGWQPEGSGHERKYVDWN